MPRVTCDCGARYKVPETSIGKKSKCKQCGAVFTLTPDEEDVIAIAVADPEPSGGEAPVQRESFHVDRPPAPPAPSSVIQRTYLGDVLWTFLFPSSPANLIAFAMLCGSMAVLRPLAGFVPFAGFFVSLLIIGWYCAFRFEVIRGAAAGDENLPDLNMDWNLMTDLVDPFFQWIGSWVLVFLPTVFYLMSCLSSGTISGMDLVELLTGGVSGLLAAGTGELRMLFVLVVLGLCAWPIVALCIAMGGFSTLTRPDLIFLTVVKTLPSYVAMLVFMFAAVALEQLLTGWIGAGLASKAGGAGATVAQTAGTWMLVYALVTCSGIYLDIVLMRLIGLHYHHFKRRFAWEWE